MNALDIRKLIEAGLPGSSVTVLGDDGQHFEAEVESPDFVGKSMVEQHRLVYASLGGRMGKEIHALKLRTRAPRSGS